MELKLFNQKHGLIPACDFLDIDKFEKVIQSTCDIEGIVGYKVGFGLSLRYGLGYLVKKVEKYTDLPVIYDHQKGGTDIPQMGELFAEVCAEAGVRGVIIFPQSGPLTETDFIRYIQNESLVPIVGGAMTHPKYLAKDGGFIRDDAPDEIYKIAANNKVEHFVVPGNKPDLIKRYHTSILSATNEPKYLMPGIGRQGGEIKLALKNLGGFSAYAIIGASIYEQSDIRAAAKRFSDEILA